MTTLKQLRDLGMVNVTLPITQNGQFWVIENKSTRDMSLNIEGKKVKIKAGKKRKFKL